MQSHSIRSETGLNARAASSPGYSSRSCFDPAGWASVPTGLGSRNWPFSATLGPRRRGGGISEWYSNMLIDSESRLISGALFRGARWRTEDGPRSSARSNRGIPRPFDPDGGPGGSSAPDLAAKVDASDLVQETFLAAGRDIAQFEGAARPSCGAGSRGSPHLLANSAGTTAGHGSGGSDREVACGAVGMGPAGIRRPSGVGDLAERPCHEEEREDALRHGDGGPPRALPAVIQWHHQERLTFEAIAQRLGISPEAARKIWGRAAPVRKALGSGHDPR